ncbi:hypothetical protein [Halorubrum sp. SD612]|uniref:DUF7529 family protein n=1 Tax=Halorubrum sp. SD612 TaxID=1855863 RepID=UPI000A2D863F|nr:hypothetical protein [Halorubrum sp. SD612]OTF12055.1 hypothetical protein B9G38_03325 [Halorubrum sp. SD612]
MPEPTEDPPTSVEARKDAWRRTLQEMESIASELETEGWETVAIPVGHAAPEVPDVGEEGRFGFVHVIPGNYESAFREAFEADGFERYDVFHRDIGGKVFFLLQLLDAPSRNAILLAAQYDNRHGQSLRPVTEEEGVVYTHVQKLDTTHLGSFRHDEPGKFFPED